MNDAGHGIQIDIQTAPFSVFEQKNANIRYALGYISGEFSKNITTEDLFINIHFKRGLNMEWETITYKLNPGRKVFRQKILDKRKTPQQLGLIVTEFYVQLYGWISPNPADVDLEAEFELTDFELSIKEIPIGKHAGEPLGLTINPEIPDPPVIPDFVMSLDIVGEVQASSARAVWYTNHPATSRVIFGTSPVSMSSEIYDASFSEFHDLLVHPLNVNQLYYAQFYSISQITGEEIYSDVKSFFTGHEIIVTNILDNPIVDFTILDLVELNITSEIGTSDLVMQTIPDGDSEIVLVGGEFSLHDKSDLQINNIIQNDYDYSVL